MLPLQSFPFTWFSVSAAKISKLQAVNISSPAPHRAAILQVLTSPAPESLATFESMNRPQEERAGKAATWSPVPGKMTPNDAPGGRVFTSWHQATTPKHPETPQTPQSPESPDTQPLLAFYLLWVL